MNDNISDKDKKDWENFLSSDEKLPNKDIKFSKKKILKIKHIDLHGFTLEQANTTIEKFIDDCYQNNVSKIIVVTGKGLHSNVEKDPYVSKDLSILKYSVPEFIENNSALMKKIIEIKDAKIASEVNATVENIGARRLHTIIEKILDDISFTATDRAGEKIIINKEYINKNLDNLVKDTDLSKFIL